MTLIFMLVMFVPALGACGKTGDLYLPAEDAGDTTGDRSGETPAVITDAPLDNGSETQD